MRPNKLLQSDLALLTRVMVDELIDNPNKFAVEKKDLPKSFGLSKTATYRMERFPKEGPIAGFAFYVDGHLEALLSNHPATVRRYAVLSRHFPIESLERSYSGILIAALIERGKYEEQMPQEGTAQKDFYDFTQSLIPLEAWLNKAGSIRNKNEFIATVDEALDSNVLNVNTCTKLNLLKTAAENCKDAESLTALLSAVTQTQKNLYTFLQEAIHGFLDELKARYPLAWDATWQSIVLQIKRELIAPNFARPRGPVPESDLHWTAVFILATQDDNNLETLTLSASPCVEEAIHFLHATDSNHVIDRENHAQYLAASKQFAKHLTLLATRLVTVPLDVVQTSWNALPGTPKVSYLSSQLEGMLLTHAAFASLPRESIMRDAVLTSSSQLMEFMQHVFLTRDLPKHLYNAAKSCVYMLFSPVIASIELASAAFAELRQGKAFSESLTDEKIQTVATALIAHIQEQVASFKCIYPEESHSNFYTIFNTLKEKITAITRDESEDKEKKFAALAECHFEFELHKCKLNNYRAITPTGWDVNDIPGITSFFPSKLTREFSQYLIALSHDQRGGTLLAALLATLGICDVPGLASVVEATNKVLSGKSLEDSGVIMRLFMGVFSFQALSLVSTLPYVENSAIMTTADLLQKDPLKIAGAITFLVELAKLHLTEPAIKGIRFASCNLNLRKTGLMMLPEEVAREIFETEKLASFASAQQLILVIKELMVLHSFIMSNQPHAHLSPGELEQNDDDDFRTNATLKTELSVLNGELDAVSMLLMRITWEKFSGDHDITGLRRSSWFNEMSRKITSLSLDPFTQQQLTRAIYRTHIENGTAVAADFLRHATLGLSLSLAFAIPIVPQTTVTAQSRSLKWNLHSVADFTRWGLNTTLLAFTRWWLFGYNSDRDGGIFKALISDLLHLVGVSVFRNENSTEGHRQCMDVATCLSLTSPEENPLMHEFREIIDQCYEDLTRCSCLPEDDWNNTWNNITTVVKWVGLILVVLNAAVIWLRWNDTPTQEMRAKTKSYWSDELLRMVMTLIHATYVLATYGAASADLSVDAWHNLISRICASQTSYAPQEDHAKEATATASTQAPRLTSTSCTAAVAGSALRTGNLALRLFGTNVRPELQNPLTELYTACRETESPSV